MRHVFLVALFFCIAAPVALAQDAPALKSDAPPDRVQLVEDEANGKLRIVIDGREVGWFDASGVTVNGDITYTGVTTDVGSLPQAEAADE